jgi:hypothetical protein
VRIRRDRILAAHADRRRRLRIGGIQPSRINDPVGVTNVAAERYRKCRRRGAEASLSMRNGSRDPQIGPLVRHACELRHDTARNRKRFVDIPERARAADAGKMKVGRRLPL